MQQPVTPPIGQQQFSFPASYIHPQQGAQPLAQAQSFPAPTIPAFPVIRQPVPPGGIGTHAKIAGKQDLYGQPEKVGYVSVPHVAAARIVGLVSSM